MLNYETTSERVDLNKIKINTDGIMLLQETEPAKNVCIDCGITRSENELGKDQRCIDDSSCNICTWST